MLIIGRQLRSRQRRRGNGADGDFRFGHFRQRVREQQVRREAVRGMRKQRLREQSLQQLRQVSDSCAFCFHRQIFQPNEKGAGISGEYYIYIYPVDGIMRRVCLMGLAPNFSERMFIRGALVQSMVLVGHRKGDPGNSLFSISKVHTTRGTLFPKPTIYRYV